MTDCTSKLGLVNCRKSSVTDSDQGCVVGVPLAEARLKRMKTVAVFDELDQMLTKMSFKGFCQNREERYWPRVNRVRESFGSR